MSHHLLRNCHLRRHPEYVACKLTTWVQRHKTRYIDHNTFFIDVCSLYIPGILGLKQEKKRNEQSSSERKLSWAFQIAVNTSKIQVKYKMFQPEGWNVLYFTCINCYLECSRQLSFIIKNGNEPETYHIKVQVLVCVCHFCIDLV